MNSYLILLIIGSVMVIEGLPYFLFPERTKKFYKKIESADIRALRAVGLIIISIGLAIVFLVKSKICE